jgi:hypothetical protein
VITKACLGCGYNHNAPDNIHCDNCGAYMKVLAEGLKTQKAKGLFTLANAYGYMVSLPKAVVGVKDGEFIYGDALPSFPFFARPCPTRPRHGFVESRVVKDLEEFAQVVKETAAEDENGEVMCGPFIQSSYNMIWTPSLFCIGEGHDGATAGRGTINYPLSGTIPPKIAALLEMAGVGEGEWPYIEVVSGQSSGFKLTQLRAGPAGVGGGPDYLPKSMVVKEILKVDPSSDLLVWEKLIMEKKDQDGVVVYHPTGSLVDHFSVHARSVGIPIITSHPVEVGDQIERVDTAPAPDPSSLLWGIAAAEKFPLTSNSWGAATKMILAGLHNSSGMGGVEAKWIGVAVGMMLRLGTAALKGEARHVHKGGVYPVNGKPDRTSVYLKVLPYSLRKLRAMTPRLIHVLRYGEYGGSGIGGPKWGRCGVALLDLYNAVGKLARGKDQDGVGEVIRSLNRAVNQAHNGGWWLNKFCDMGSFTTIQTDPLQILCQLTSTILELDKIGEGLSTSEVDRKIGLWGTWKETIARHLPITKAEITILPGSPGVAFKVEDRILKGGHRSMVIPIEPFINNLAPIIGGKLWVVPGEKGLRFELRRPHEEPLLIYEEPDLDSLGEPNLPKVQH